VYVGSNDGHLYAVEAWSGEEQWAALTAAPVKSSPTVSGSTVYFGTIDDRLFAVPTTGPTEPLTPTPTPEPERTPTPEQTPTGTPTETVTEVPTATPREANDEETESGPNAGTVAEGGQTPAGAAGVDADDGGQALSLPGDVPMAPAVGATLLGSVALGAIGQRLRDDEDDSNDTSARESSDPGGPASADNGSEAGGSAPTTTESGSPGSEAAAGRSRPTAPGGGGRSADGPTRSLQRGDPSDRPSSVPTPPALRLSYLDLDRGDRIGTGGNADVYRATASGPDGPVDLAIKEPRVEGTLHADTVERVVQEAETWADLDDHDHIVGVVDWGSEPLPWIAMEHMDAGHLGDWLAGDPSLVERLWVGYGVVKGVRHAHRHGVAHLDLKPENVLFRSTGAETWPVPKIADWGLSKHLLDHSNSVEGLTPAYAAPEQFDGDRGPTDNVTDVYQLGAVLYELFTGQPPFEGPPSQVMHDILHEDPAPPGEHVQLPPAVDEMILRALATERTERYDSVLYLRDDIQEIVQSL
jgi:hypothetical protein